MKIDVTAAAGRMVKKGEAFSAPSTSLTSPEVPGRKKQDTPEQEPRVLVQIRVPKLMHRQLKQMALDGDTSIQDLMESWIREKL
jgi:hypothetical protein